MAAGVTLSLDAFNVVFNKSSLIELEANSFQLALNYDGKRVLPASIGAFKASL
jgi:hypothetical protein